MTPTDRSLFRLEIIEDSKDGVSIRLHHSGRLPDVLAGVPKDILRKARPWVWSSHERRILRKARSMHRQTFRVVRDTLLLERVKLMMAQRPQHDGRPRLTWLERRRLVQGHFKRLKEAAMPDHVRRQTVVRPPAELPEGPARKDRTALSAPEPRPLTLTEQMRQVTGAERAEPRAPDPRIRSR